MFEREMLACRKARKQLSELGISVTEDEVIETGLTALLLQGEWTCLDTAVDQAIEIVMRHEDRGASALERSRGRGG